MSCIKGQHYNIGLECRYAKITKNKNDATQLRSLYAKIEALKRIFEQRVR